MGNTCTTTVSRNPTHVVSITQATTVDDLTFSDIDKAWELARQEAAKQKNKNKTAGMARTGWKTVRVFVSSTFRDFDAEREILVKKVFPDLREWCQSRRLNLVDIDLRWGVPKDSTSETTLRTCLGEIDRCFNENVYPFFVNMTSERIGWIPLGTQLPRALKHEYKWVEGLSVTEMEILHGAYRIDNPNALFMIRDSSFLKTVPQDKQHYFVDESSIAPYKLEQLKKNIAERFSKQSRVATYNCEYSHVDLDTKMPRFKGLDDGFADVVLNFFRERIADQYPLIDEKKQDPFEEAKTQHESFMKMASERTVGRDVLINEFIDSYVFQMEHFSPVVIYGGPGLGKTSIMAALADKCTSMALKHQLPNPTTSSHWKVFTHFVGAIAGSTDQLAMLNRFLLESKSLREDAKRPTTVDEALGLVRGALSNPKTKNCIIIVDAINQFDDLHGMPAPVSWLPSKMSPSVRVFFSLTPESSQFKIVREAGEGWTFLQLQPLDRDIKERMVTSHLARYNKQLDRGQLELLLNKRSSDNPMWLSLATEELRVFGRFRELTNKIGTLPDGLAELENEILGRFERESDGVRLIAALCLLESSVRGLLESELLELLADSDLLPPELETKITVTKTYNFEGDGDDERLSAPISGGKQERLTAAQWADVYRVLRPFMRPFGASGEGRLDFYHRSLSKAVRNRYFYRTEKQPDGSLKQVGKRENVVKFFHKKLAEYFGKKGKHLERRVEEFPTHAWKSDDVNGLTEFLCDWNVFDLMYDPEFARELSEAWEHVYFMMKGKHADHQHVFRELEINYVREMGKILKASQECDKEKTVKRMEQVTKILAQNGCFEAAEKMSQELIDFAYPNVDADKPTDYDKLPFSKREFNKTGQSLGKDDRLKYAYLLHLKGNVRDEVMRQVDYMLQSHIPQICTIIDCFEGVIAVLQEIAPDDELLGRTLNRCSFYYSGLACRGGGRTLISRADCTTMAVKRIEEAIEFYKTKEGQMLNLADCYITRGVAVLTAKPEQIENYYKGLKLIHENAGQLHPLLDRCYLNIAIYFEEINDMSVAYDYFRKWYDFMVEMYGRNHTRTHRAARTLNETAYSRIAKVRGDPIPTVGIQVEEDTKTIAPVEEFSDEADSPQAEPEENEQENEPALPDSESEHSDY